MTYADDPAGPVVAGAGSGPDPYAGLDTGVAKRWGRQAGYEPAGAGTAEPGIVVPGWMR
jgi:hypothetical protein